MGRSEDVRLKEQLSLNVITTVIPMVMRIFFSLSQERRRKVKTF